VVFVAAFVSNAGRLTQPPLQHEWGGPDKYSGSWLYDACAAPHLLPAFTPECFRGLAQWEVVSSYSSATAPDSHGISCADPLFQARKEL